MTIRIRCIFLLFFLPAIAAAQDAPTTAPSATTPQPMIRIMTASASSLNAVKELAAMMGVQTLPPMLTPEGLGRSFRFIGRGGVQADQPIGIAFYVAPDLHLSRGQGVVFEIPVKETAATTTTLTRMGAYPVPQRPDCMQLRLETFRRTPTQVIFGMTPESVYAHSESDLADPYKSVSPDHATLAHLDVNLASVRKAMPEQVQTVWQGLKATIPPAANANEQFGQDIAINFFQNLNRCELNINKSGQDLELNSKWSSYDLPAGGHLEKQGMPPGVMARLDIAVPLAPALPRVKEFLATILKNERPREPHPLSVDDEQSTIEIIMQSSEVLLGGRAVSIGVRPRGKNTIVYVVQQNDKPIDLPAKLQQMVDQVNAQAAKISTTPDADTAMVLDNYTATDGLHVSRVRLVDRGTTFFNIDATQIGNRVFFAGCIDAENHISKLAPLQPDGQFDGIVTGSVVLGPLLETIQNMSQHGAAPSPDFQNLLGELKDENVSFDVRGQADTLELSVILPRTVVTDVSQYVIQTRRARQPMPPPQEYQPPQPRGGGL